MSQLQLTLLGSFAVHLDGKAVADFYYEKGRALLAYLAVEGDVVHRREHLAGLLWPDDAESDARRTLRVVLHRLRDDIGDREAVPPFLSITRSTLRINPEADVEVDVRAFTGLVAATGAHNHQDVESCRTCLKKLADAAELYQGELLPAFSLDSVIFEEWLTAQREALHLQALEVLDHLTTHHLTRQAYDVALDYARRQIALEPWRESAHRQAMAALASRGRRAEAVAQYESCAEVLSDELGIEPEMATVKLYERIRRGELASPDPMPSGDRRRPVPRTTDAASPLPERSTFGLPSMSDDSRSPTVASPGGLVPPSELGLPDESRPRGEPRPRGERRTTTLVLAEITGAAALPSDRDFETWAETRHDLMETLRAQVARYGGTMVQARDAGLVAAFGAQSAHEDDPERAVLAALAMTEAFAPARERAILSDLAGDLALTVGVTTDEAVVLPRQDGGVAVHAVALAEADSILGEVPPGTVWVTASTYRQVAAQFEWSWLGDVVIADLDPVRLYRPVAPASTPSEHTTGGLRAALVGRGPDLQGLTEAVARVRAGIGGIVTVVGEAGIGKSRLVAESRVTSHESTAGDAEPARDIDAVWWVEGRWLSYAEGAAYAGWQEILRELLDLSDDCTRAECEALEDRIAALCPGRTEAIYPYVARLLALPVDEATAARLDSLVAAGMLQSAIFRTMADLLTCAAMLRPLAIVLEDLHWADEASLALLEYLMALTDRLPLLFVVVMRPARAHGSWQVREAAIRDYAHRHLDIQLAPLTSDESEVLVRRLLAQAGGETAASAAVVDDVIDRAEGNPFFAAEIVRSLADQDITTDPPSIDALPTTVRGMLLARIDRLPVAARQVLQLAAVAGRVFQYRVLADIVAGDVLEPAGRTLDTALLHLVRSQMVRESAGVPNASPEVLGTGSSRGPSGAPDRVYTFDHQLTLEAAYGSLLQRKRRLLHRRVAEALERLYPAQIAARLGVLAHHWEKAGDREKALDYLTRAGEQAAAQYANASALALFSRALDLVAEADWEKRYDLLLARERIYHRIGNREAQSRDLRALSDLADRANDGQKQAEVALRRAEQAALTYDASAAVSAAEAALDLAQTLDDTRFEALALLRLGQAVADSGAASVQALDRFRQALALAETVDDRRLKAEALYEMGTIMGREEHTKGRDLIRRALELYREVGDRVGEGWALNALTLTHGAFGEYKQAQARGMESLAVLREVGDRRGEGYRRTAYGYSTMCLGAYSEALDSLREGRAICREVGETVYEARAVVAMAMLFDLVGDYARAWSRAEEALAFPEERSGLLNRAWMLAEAGLILLHRDDVEGAHDYADRALEFMDRAGDAATHGWIPHARMWAHLVRGHALLELGDADGAAQAYEAGLSVERKAGPPGMPAELRAGLARVHLIREVPAAAMKEVEEILDYLQTSHIHGTAEPPRIYFTCYQVLTAVGDTRAAPVLDEAYRFLMDRAGMIDEASLRRSYLEAVDVNRRIVSAYRSAPDLA